MDITQREDDKRTMVFIDSANYHYGLRKLGWQIDYDKLNQWLHARYNTIGIYAYTGIHSEKSFLNSKPEIEHQERSVKLCLFNEYKKKQKAFFHNLRGFGYHVFVKPIWSIYDNTSGDYTLKCNCDVELTMDALLKANEYDRIILGSGDGDFTRLIKYLKYINKTTVVMSIRDRTSSLLLKHCNKLITLGSIKPHIEFIRA